MAWWSVKKKEVQEQLYLPDFIQGVTSGFSFYKL
jgi:hypothetical protein